MNIYELNTKAMTRQQLTAEIEFRKSILTDDASPEFYKEIEILEKALANKPERYSITDAWKQQFENRIQRRANRLGITYDQALADWQKRFGNNR